MPVFYETKDRIGYITIDGRGDYNIFSPDLVYKPLTDVLEGFRDDPETWCALVTVPSHKKVFTYGGDIQSLDALQRGEQSLTRGYGQGGSYSGVVTGLFDLNKPVIFAINGPCIGAGTLLMMSLADVVVCSENATFGWPEIRQAIGPYGSYGPGMLPRQLPWRIALELLVTGRLLNAQEAYMWGFVNRVVPTDEVLPLAVSIAEEICGNPPLHVQAAKEMARASKEIPYRDGMIAGRLHAEVLRGLPDSKEGPRAFLEKRKPVYTGKKP